MEFPLITSDPATSSAHSDPSTPAEVSHESGQPPLPGFDALSTVDTGKRRKSKRGFAAMSSEKQREIASLGGKAVHAKGTAHEFTSEEARAAGRKGGAVTKVNRVRAKPV